MLDKVMNSNDFEKEYLESNLKFSFLSGIN